MESEAVRLRKDGVKRPQVEAAANVSGCMVLGRPLADESAQARRGAGGRESQAGIWLWSWLR